MKSNKAMAIATLFLAGSLSMGLQAQENLKALVKKCESMNHVDMDVVYKKDRVTKKTERVIKTLSFTDAQLMNDFLTAFEKDKNAAYRVIESKKSGKIRPSFYGFFEGTTETSYSFDLKDSGKVSISVIEKHNQTPDDWGG